nr:glycosyltransferase family 4 protein [uncultured Eisenbergiella sp.]
MKVLIINKFLYPNGGSETYIFEIGKQLERMGHEVQYFGMEHEGRIVGNHAESYTSDMDFHSGKLQKLLYPFRIIYSVEARKKLRRVLEDFGPDAVHLNNFNFQLTPSVIYAIKAYEKKHGKKITIIYTAHDSQLVCPNHLMQNPISGEACTKCMESGLGNCVKDRCIHGSRSKSLLGAMEGWLYKRLRTYGYIDKIICPSIFMKCRLQTESALREKLVVMPNFINMEAVKGDIWEKENYILYFGRYSVEKGIGTLLKACKKNDRIPFVFAGDGPLAGEVNSCSNIENRGFLKGNKLFDTIRKAQFTIIPSECYENCPFSVMESIACKTPVLGADIGGIPELIEQGVTGELFHSGDETDLCNKIQKLWGEKKKLSEYSENCGAKRFDTVEAYCEKLLFLYQGRD